MTQDQNLEDIAGFAVAQDVALLILQLRKLKEQHDTADLRSDPSARRNCAGWALQIVSDFIRSHERPGEGLDYPFLELLGALIAVDTPGVALPIITPEKAGPGRKPRSYSRRLFEPYPCASVDILMETMSEDEAASFVAAELNKHSYKIDGADIDKRQVLEWRRRLREHSAGSPEAECYWRLMKNMQAVGSAAPGHDSRLAIKAMLARIAGSPFGPAHVGSPPKGE